MRASDIMTTGVITVGLNTPVEVISRTLLSNRISAVPVLDEHGALVGIVSEADLIHRVEIGTEGSDFLKSYGVKAVDVMTSPIIAANPEMRLDELVSLFDRHRIKRVPVVDHGKIVGIVSRSNILQVLARKDFAHEPIADAA
jgi:CBS-domain-containing membrane protein